MERAPNVVGLQELKETNQNLQAENAKLRRLLWEAEEEKQRLLHKLQSKNKAFERL